MAQGTFDILHPGHLHYLENSAKLGDRLTVVISRDARTEKELHFNEDERKKMVEALQVVDRAVLGSKKDIFTTVQKIDPELITLGYDQGYDTEKVKQKAEKATGHKIQVKRISNLKNYSSSNIKN
ncbi:MAG: adenylyltransferase/cytidyltransferase family protein [Candidatus Nanohalobium sp.]